MRKMKKVASRVAAFTLATMMTVTGTMDGFFGYKNFSFTKEVEAATVTGTVGADTFSWDNASVYFLLTDRFKNGNTSNDHSYNRGLDKNGNVVNVSDDRGTFHGGDFAGITQAIKDGYFNDLGVNALWISAPYEQIHGYIVGGDGSPSFAHYSYHGYYVLDYTNTDANFGTEEEFKEMVDTAHEHGLRVVLDVVLNHAGYNSLYDMNEYGFGDLKSGWDSYYFSMSNVNNSDYHSYVDYNSSADSWGRWWGPGWIRSGLPGYTSGGSDDLTMSLTGLPDFKTESTATVGIPTFLETKWKREGRYDEEVNELKNYLNANGYKMTVTNCISYWLSTWVREYGVDGFRCDTAKHVDKASWGVLNDMCTDALKDWKAANPDKKLDDLDFWMTGEAWGHGVTYDDYYTTGKFDSMINFDVQGGGSLALGSVANKYSSYANAINSKDGFNVLSYISSHDSTLARGDMKYLGSALLMLPGGIQIFYGDETNRPLDTGYAFDGNGGAGHSLRTDMNWDNKDEEVLAHWQKVGTFRNNHIAVGAGSHTASSSTSGVAFTRTYSKNGVSDRIAACIGASANTSVTIGLNGVWSDGEVVTNYYDGTTAVVTDGKVTFNSGANGTVLVGDSDGKPTVSITGSSKFKGTQKVTININGADSAIVSVDGGKKFVAYDGDQFEIGATAYEGDTITVEYKATYEDGVINGKTTFYKEYANEVTNPAKVRVKMSDGSAPYLHAWTETGALTGDWPGKQFTQKDSEGYYYMELDTTGKYNIIFNGGLNKPQTADIENITGTVTYNVQAGFGSYEQVGGSGGEIPEDITIRVKPYGSAAPYLYVWKGATTYNGGWPGKQLTEKDADGNYVLTVSGVSSVNCIANNGNGAQSKDLEGISGDTLITVNSADYGNCTVEKKEAPASKFGLMKQEARSVKNMTSSDYTTETWNALYPYVAKADELVALGEDKADAAQVEELYNDIVAAKKALVLAAPKVTSASSGSKVVSGTAVCEATVSVTVGGKTYTAAADEVTGRWGITASSNLTASSVITMTAAKNGLKSATATYKLSGGSEKALAVTIKASSQNVNKGESVTLTAAATGGSGGYTYSFLINNVDTGEWYRYGNGTFKAANTHTWKASTTGNKKFYVEVKDSTGKVVRSSAVNIKVNDTIAAALSVTAKASKTTANKGDKVTITAAATGGSGSYTYSFLIYSRDTKEWYRFNKTFKTGNTHTWTATTTGNKTFYAEVKDSTGKVVRSSGVNVSVAGGTTSALAVTAKANAFLVGVGTKVTVTGTATGGSGSYTYSFLMCNTDTNEWYRFNKTFKTSNTQTWTAGSVGHRKFFVEVKDSTGKVVRSSAVAVDTQ